MKNNAIFKKVLSFTLSLLIIISFTGDGYAKTGSEKKESKLEISSIRECNEKSLESTTFTSYQNSIIIKSSFIDTSYKMGIIEIPFELYCFGGSYEKYYVEVYDSSYNLMASTDNYFPRDINKFDITLTWDASKAAPGKYYVHFYSTYDRTFYNYYCPFYIEGNEGEFFNKEISGTQSAINSNLSNPMSAWKNTSATLKRYSFEESIPYDIRLEEMYIGDTANAIVSRENSLNTTANNNQQWILMKYYLKNRSSQVLTASDIIYTSYFYTSSGAKMQILDMASFAGNRQGLSVFDLDLYGGASGYCWIGILVPKSVGLPYLQINNGYSNNKENVSWLNTNPNYVYTPSYKITFKSNGGNASSKSSINIVKNQKYGKLPTCKRKGYIFKGWYTSAKGGSKVSENTVCKDKATLYAQWTKVSTGKSSISSLSNGKKSFTVKWKKVSGATGYEVCYSTNSKFTPSKKINISSSILSKKVSSLSAKKKYYVKVRAYKKDSTGGKIYGSWSSVKYIKTK